MAEYEPNEPQMHVLSRGGFPIEVYEDRRAAVEVYRSRLSTESFDPTWSLSSVPFIRASTGLDDGGNKA